MRSVVDRNVVMQRIPAHSKGRGVKRLDLWFVRCGARGETSEPAGAAVCVAVLSERPGMYELRVAVKKLYQLRPKVSASRVSVASRVVKTKHDDCIPRLVGNFISCIERYGCAKCPTIGRFLPSFIVLYCTHNYMHTDRQNVEWYRQHRCYIVLRSNV
jgi:hypothetical protein